MKKKILEEPLSTIIEGVDLTDVEFDEEIPGAGGPEEVKREDGDRPPLMTSLEWTPWVMKQFDPDELLDGYPTCSSMRRMTEVLLGPIVQSTTKIVQAPSSANGFHAAVEHTVVIRMVRDLEEGMGAYDAVYTDVADVCPINTADPYWQHATSTAATRAAGRCYRQALRLHRVYAAEEMNDGVTGQSNPSYNCNFVNESQLNFFDMMCGRMNINVEKLINAGETKYSNIGELPYRKALEVFDYLNKVQIGTKKPPEGVTGYEVNWRKKVKVKKE